MNDHTKKNGRSGLLFLDALTLIFITLKLIGVIDWAWKWVLAPMWIPFLLIIIISAVFIFIVNS